MIHADGDIYEAALDALQRGQSVALAVVIETSGSAPRDPGAKMLVHADGRTIGTVGGGPSEAWVIEEARQALSDGKSRLLQPRGGGEEALLCGGAMRFFVDVLIPSPTLLIIGAGHIGQAVASMGAWLGFKVAVLDERAALVSPEHLPEADVLLTGPLDEELRGCQLTEQTYTVLVTPHNSADEKALSVLAEHAVPYVGLLGGRRRTQATFERARELGVPDAFLEQIHTPVGLDIRAESPREIALSILAEITAVRRRGS